MSVAEIHKSRQQNGNEEISGGDCSSPSAGKGVQKVFVKELSPYDF